MSGSASPNAMSGLEHDVSLQGAAATEWLQARGFLASRARGTPRLFADEIAHAGFILRRMWLSGIEEVSFPVDPSMFEAFEASLAVRGNGVLAHTPGVLQEGKLLLRRRSEIAVVRIESPLAVIQVESELRRLSYPGDISTGLIAAEPDFALGFVSLATAILNSSIGPASPGFSHLRQAIEAVLSALLSNDAASPPFRNESKALRDHYHRAARYIEAHASDPSLSLPAIAAGLNLSEKYLQRVFRNVETTPMRYLNLVRAKLAESLLHSHPHPSPELLRATAARCGFRTVQTMRDAIARMHAAARTIDP